MRTENKLQNGNVLICWDVIEKLSVRKPGKEEKNNYEDIIRVDAQNNSIIIDKDIAEAYGINIEIKEVIKYGMA